MKTKTFNNVIVRKNVNYAAVAVFAIILFFIFLNSNQASAAELPQPTIVIHPDIYYPLDEVLYLEGRAASNYAIELRFQKQGAKPLTYRTKSDSRGEWVFAEKIRLAAGDWEVRARIVDSQDPENISEWSNPRVFKAAITGITIGGINIKFAALSLVIIILLILGVMLVLYFTGRVSRLKAALLDKEIREAREAAHKGFSEMRQNLLDELKSLESRKNLSSEELERKAHLLRDLENLERGVEKEIDDIQERR